VTWLRMPERPEWDPTPQRVRHALPIEALTVRDGIVARRAG
jgi:hypothetical protein